MHVALAHLLSHVDLAAHHLAADAEALVDFVARLHGAEVAVGFLRLVVADLDGAHGAQRFRDGGFDEHALKAATAIAAMTTNAGAKDGFTMVPRIERLGFMSWRIRIAADAADSGDGLEHLPAAAERLVQLHAVEQQLRVASLAPTRTARRTRCASRSGREVDLATVVQRLRTAERRVRRCRGAVEQLLRAAVHRSARRACSRRPRGRARSRLRSAGRLRAVRFRRCR